MSAGGSDASGCPVTTAAIGWRRTAEVLAWHRLPWTPGQPPPQSGTSELTPPPVPDTAAASRAPGRLPADGATRSLEIPECADQGLLAEGRTGRGKLPSRKPPKQEQSC